MGVSIGSNNAALRALLQLGRNASALERNFERLSSGMRINRASDDAAGLAISLGLGKDARVFNQALRNANDGISALNVAGEALDGANGILVRLKELATQAASGSLSRMQRLALDQESQALTGEFNRMMATADFNGLKLLDGRFGRMSIQVGYGNNGSIGFNIGSELDRNLAAGYGSFTGCTMADLSAGNPMLYDLNNDGNLDIIANDMASMNVRLGNGDGTFKAQTNYAFAAVATKTAVADVNGDGKLDLISGNASSFLIRHGNGDGTFAASTSVAAGGSVAGYVAIGDVNGDGIADLVGASNASNLYRIALGTGGGLRSSRYCGCRSRHQKSRTCGHQRRWTR